MIPVPSGVNLTHRRLCAWLHTTYGSGLFCAVQASNNSRGETQAAKLIQAEEGKAYTGACGAVS